MPETEHSLDLRDRKKLTVNGVEDVTGFDENTVVLRTNMGMLVVGGEQLHIEKIDPDAGVMQLEGKINELSYRDVSPAASVWKRLFG